VLRAALRFPVKARAISSSFDRLASTPLPALAELKDGAWMVVGRIADDKVLVQDPLSAVPEALSREAFESRWSGRLVLIARRAALGDVHSRFGVGWFVDAVKKVPRAAHREVLASSFFPPAVRPAGPLFLPGDHRQGVRAPRAFRPSRCWRWDWACCPLFEVVLGGLRTWLFAHTSNRIDVELGARLFRHLLALPLGYFQVRRVGDHGRQGPRARHHPTVS